jgi:hypothetical protein
MPVNLFDPNTYRYANLELTTLSETQAQDHFQTSGINEGRIFSSLVDLNFYRASNPDLAAAGITTNTQLLDHLQTQGIAEGRSFSPIVDLNFYRNNNPDLATAGLTTNEQLFTHLQTYGVGEGRTFSQLLDLSFYLSRQSPAGVKPLSLLRAGRRTAVFSVRGFEFLLVSQCRFASDVWQ